jgi:hypothetical protein
MPPGDTWHLVVRFRRKWLYTILGRGCPDLWRACFGGECSCRNRSRLFCLLLQIREVFLQEHCGKLFCDRAVTRLSYPDLGLILS